jgi:glutamate-1-semialdehyde 2,1-aminomutase
MAEATIQPVPTDGVISPHTEVAHPSAHPPGTQTIKRVIEKSTHLFSTGRALIPDGVSASMRAFMQVGGHPICVAQAKGSQVTDADGNVYVDFLNCFGALILGHAREEVVEAISRQASMGTAYGLSTELEYQLADKIVRSTPAIEMVRFVCSGTEAVMTAARIARSHTGRSLLLKFKGAYHGHSDALLASPQNLDTSALKSKGVTHGITAQLNHEVLLCDYNDTNQLEELFFTYRGEIAAVLVEPYATNMGFVKPQPGFHKLIRSLCDRDGALLIFDEVVTGFRCNFGGVCTALDITPDLITFGKIIGGGTPVGAFAGKAHLMKHVAIGSKVFQSGTFAANPLTMAAGNATLDVLGNPGFYQALEAKGACLESAIVSQFTTKHIPFHFSRHGALAGVAFRDSREPMQSYKDVKTQQYDVFEQVHRHMLDRGFLMPPSLEEPIFLSAAHTEEDLAAFAAALAESIDVAMSSPERQPILSA